MQTEQFINEALHQPPGALYYHVSQQLADRFPGRTILETSSWKFKLESYARAGLCSLRPKETIHNEFLSDWFGAEEGIYRHASQVWWNVRWQDSNLEVLMIHQGYEHRYWIMADIAEVVESFFAAVCEWELEVRAEVLVFDGECWHKDEELFQAIKNATFDNLVLKGNLAQQILADIKRFFNARATYERYGIPWKRGILLVGPPGNGKTHAVKALINALPQPCLYIKSFKSGRSTDESNIRGVFERAREYAPCVVVLEDLDAQITPQNRSFFLNELDGFATNSGILTLATTNYPEKLDPAIINRPSRFDRKYHFNLPGEEERLAYILRWNRDLLPELHLTEQGAAEVARLSDGFSFAYLKELFLTAMMEWINQDEEAAPDSPRPQMDQVMVSQVALLKEQMNSFQPDNSNNEKSEDEDEEE
jgi:hypothetical protein